MAQMTEPMIGRLPGDNSRDGPIERPAVGQPVRHRPEAGIGRHFLQTQRCTQPRELGLARGGNHDFAIGGPEDPVGSRTGRARAKLFGGLAGRKHAEQLVVHQREG